MQPQQPPQSRNLILFFILAFIMYIAWMDLQKQIWPPPAKPTKAEVAKKSKEALAKERAAALAAVGAWFFIDQAECQQSLVPGPMPLLIGVVESVWAAVKEVKPPTIEKPQNIDDLFPPPPTPEQDLLHIGSTQGDSAFHLGVAFDPRGAGVRSIILNKFQAATDEGLPAWEDEAHTLKKPLELIPATSYNDEASYLLYHFDTDLRKDQDHPLDTLGRARWRGAAGAERAKVEQLTLEDGRKQQRIVFEAVAQGVVVTKTYTLTEQEYHLGLEVKFRRKDGSAPDKVPFRYQLTGGHGLPVEGKWYTTTFRNALIARVNSNDRPDRYIQDLRQINSWEGGDEIKSEKDLPVRFFGVAVQYFASVIAVDDEQKNRSFLAMAQPTLEALLVKGQVKSIAADHSSFELRTDDKHDKTCFVPPDRRQHFAEMKPGDRVAVIFRQGSYNTHLKTAQYPSLAVDWQPEETTHALWVNDLTVRAATEKVELEPGQEVVHKYVLYNGPVKVSQLYDRQNVPSELVDRYHDKLHLNTLTDYQSPGFFGSWITGPLGLSWLVIKCTNLMHIIVSLLNSVIPNYGLCIILLTVLVRGLMFPISRKQQLMTLKMQQLQPELKKIMEKFKDNRQALAAAQMELYRKHGVNPFGTCWFLMLQMPIFMGLYYSLQESIRFRLASFWPLWINNLAAPDMLFHWGDKVPWISRPQDYGWILYLGPYFNLLPVIAVGFMLVQQKMLTPPPADDQQAMQMKIMRYMMIFFGLMFYKVAAGLCIYFIASSIWGLAERKLLLPKAKPGTGTPVPEAPASRVLPATGSTAIQTGGGRRERSRNRSRPGRGREEAVQPQPNGWWQRLRAWWKDVQEAARKK